MRSMIVIGIALIIMGFALLLLSPGVSYGGVVIIGPIPIVFGNSPEITIIGIALALILLVMLLMRW